MQIISSIGCNLTDKKKKKKNLSETLTTMVNSKIVIVNILEQVHSEDDTASGNH